MYTWPIIRDIVNIFGVLLNAIHSFVPNYGWAIIVLTILFRLLLLPLDIRSKLSMKKQALLQPKIAKINEKYKNDKEKAAQKTMELYRQEHASPLSGCLPSLIQMPLFIAFFGALSAIAGQQIFQNLYQVMINQGLDAAVQNIQPWLWVHNVWAPDTFFMGPNGINAGMPIINMLNSSIIPSYSAVQGLTSFQGITQAQYDAVMTPLIAYESGYYNGWFILPILAGLTSWLQMKLTMPPQQNAATNNGAQPNNPMTGKAMQYIFPLISVYFTASSNSVFALYWITSNIVSIVTYRGVDMVWKMNERKREQEGQKRQEDADKARAELISKTAQAKLQPAGKANPAKAPAKQGPEPGPAKPSGSPGSSGNTNPKEGKKK